MLLAAEALRNIKQSRETSERAELQEASGFAPEQPQRGRPFSPQYFNTVMAMRNRHRATGVKPATVLNFLPIDLVVNGTMYSNVRVPACPRGQLFTTYTFWDAAIVPMPLGEGITQPWDYMPIQLANEFVRANLERGGVVVLEGTPDTIDMESEAVQVAVHDATEAMYAYMTRLVEEAEGFWNSTNHQFANSIVEKHRLASMVLMDARRLTQAPAWLPVTRKEADVMEPCPICRNEPKKGALRCNSCSYVLLPAKAFMAGDIDEFDKSLERLTRAEVEELGVSAYVAETKDERPARLAAGSRKPMSHFEYTQSQEPQQEQAS